MNYHDHARASGQAPPEWGVCAHCKKRTEVDHVSMRGRVLQLCANCQRKLEKKLAEDDDLDPSKLPF